MLSGFVFSNSLIGTRVYLKCERFAMKQASLHSLPIVLMPLISPPVVTHLGDFPPDENG